MGFGDSSIFAKIEFVLIILGFLLQVVGMAVPMWYVFDIGSLTIKGGVWQVCTDSGSTNTCVDLTGTVDWLDAVAAFSVLGLVALLVALVLIILYIFCMSDKKLLQLITFILCFCAFVFILISIAVFAGQSNISSGYHFAFAFCIIAFILALAAGVLGLLDYMKKGQSAM